MNLGSRLKTPVLPIWVTWCGRSWGVLFNPNRDLMKSYQAENRYLVPPGGYSVLPDGFMSLPGG